MVRRALRFVATSAVCAIVLPIGVVATLLAALLFLPLPTELPEPRPPEGGRITRVHAANGEEIGQFREFEQNVPVAREDIPLHLKQAVISAEDRSFYSHTGIDIRGSIRALWSDLQGGQIVQGGSTITQQYVKNTYVGKERTLSRKLREAVLARQIDRTVEKDEILFRYLSTIYLGAGAYGVGAASETYFRKPVSQLTLSEAALMAGVIPAPSRYEPRENPAAAETKRSFVLDRMLDLGYIDPDLHAAARAEQVWLASRGPAPGPATVVHPPEATFSRYPYFLDYVRRYLVERYG
ncbi:MAG: transglycosylase domain-containing protein, partial [Acidimicrobiales bacterium]